MRPDFPLPEAAIFYSAAFQVWLHEPFRDDPRTPISQAVERNLDWLLADHIVAGRVRAIR